MDNFLFSHHHTKAIAQRLSTIVHVCKKDQYSELVQNIYFSIFISKS